MAAGDDAIRPIVPVRVSNAITGVSKTVFALLDCGSDRDVISDKLVDQLGIETKTKVMTIKTVDSNMTCKRKLTDFHIESLDAQYEAEIEDAMVADLRSSMSDIPPSRRDTSSWPHLADILFPDAEK